MLVILFGIVIEVKPEQPENAEEPMLVTSFPKTIVFIEGIPANQGSILFVFNVMEVKLEQNSKAEKPMLVTLLGISTEVKLEQNLKAKKPMLVTLSGISTEVKLEQR